MLKSTFPILHVPTEIKEMVSNIRKDLAAIDPGLEYIARNKTKPHHAKAGNLNHAMTVTKGDYIAIFDCDMVCLPEFLQYTLPPFFKATSENGKIVWEADQKMSLVMSPQGFYNVPHGDPLDEGESMSYDRMLLSWDGHDCAPCFGTNVVFKRAPLQDVSGFAYGSVTEDFFTSMQLHAKGYKSAYIPRHLAFGLVPTDLHSYFTQRERWIRGALQVLQIDSPWTKPGLTWQQRMVYGWHTCCAIGAICGQLPNFVLPLLLLFKANLGIFEAHKIETISIRALLTCMDVLMAVYVGWDLGAGAILRHARYQVFMFYHILLSVIVTFSSTKVSDLRVY